MPRKDGQCQRYLTEENWHKYIFIEAKKRAKKKGTEYSLTEEDELKLVKKCKGSSEWSNKPFEFEKIEGVYKRPWIPSLDRIDNSKGYVVGNVRILNCFENNLLGQFGSDVAVSGSMAIIENCMRSCIK